MATGSWSVPAVPVPNALALDGLTLVARAALAEAGAPLGVALSNGVVLAVGR